MNLLVGNRSVTTLAEFDRCLDEIKDGPFPCTVQIDVWLHQFSTAGEVTAFQLGVHRGILLVEDGVAVIASKEN